MSGSRLNDAHLQGYDISSSSIKIARQLADSAGVNERARYIEKNALELPETADGSADACICSFLVEHLEEPEKLFAELEKMEFLKPFPSRANFIFCSVLKGSAREIQEKLQNKGILVRYFDIPLLQNAIRIGVGTPQQTDILIKALREVGEEIIG